MSQIKLKYESEFNFNSEDITILVNGDLVNFQVTEEQIIIDYDEVFGVNLLKISHSNKETLKVLDLVINEDSIRSTLYLAYLDNPKRNSTWVTCDDGPLIIPFGYPVGWWYAECSTTIPNGKLGSNLYDEYEIYYPESVTVSDSYPELIKSYFKHNFGFTMIPKDEYQSPLHNNIIPSIPIHLEYDEQELFNEFTSNRNILESDDYIPSQKTTNYNKTWDLSMLIRPTDQTKTGWRRSFIFDFKDFPALYKLLEQIENFDDIIMLHGFVGIVDPGDRVDLHRDDHSNSNKFWYPNGDYTYDGISGLCTLYVPVGWTPGNYYKFHNVGLIKYDQGAMISNVFSYPHASVNDSEQVRYTIGIYCKFNGSNILNA